MITLEYVAWARQFDAEQPHLLALPVYRTDNELENTGILYTRRSELMNGIMIHNLVTMKGQKIVSDYDREEVLGYNRQEVAFYTRNVQVKQKKYRLEQLKNI